MPIKVTCQKCAGVLNAPDSAAGKKGKCPKCGNLMDIPAGVPGSKPGSPTPIAPAVKPAPKPAAEANPFDFFGDSPAEPAAAESAAPTPEAAKPSKPAPPSKPAAKASPAKPAPVSKPTPSPAPSAGGSDNPFAFDFGDPVPAPAPVEPAKPAGKSPEKPVAKPAEKPAAKAVSVAKTTPPPAPSPIGSDNPFAFDSDVPAPAPPPSAAVKAAVVPAKVAEKPAESVPARPAKLTPAAKPAPGPASDNPFAFLDTVVTDPALQPSGDAVRIGEALPPEKVPEGSGAFDVKIEDDVPNSSGGMVSGLYDVRVEEDDDDPVPAPAPVSAPTPAKPLPALPAPTGASLDDQTEGTVKIRAGANTENPSLLALRVKGYRLWLERVRIDDPANKFYPLRIEYHAESYGNHFTADSPTELLGLVGLWETRGDNWAVRRGEPDVLEELRRIAARAAK